MSPLKLIHAPIWVLFKNVPPELWLTKGFNTIASGVGFPFHSEFTKLNPYSNGVVKLKVVVELAKARPSLVRITDKFRNSVLVFASYPRLSPKCCSCSEFGHLQLRFSESFLPLVGISVQPCHTSPPSRSAVSSSLVKEGILAPAQLEQSFTSDVGDPTDQVSLPADHCPVVVTRSLSLPSSPLVSDGKSSGGWTRVVRHSKPSPPSSSDLGKEISVHQVTNSQFAAEKNLIVDAQAILAFCCS